MPITLELNGTPLYLQVRDYLSTDTDGAVGLVAALGDSTNSIYPQYETDGPTGDRAQTPTPFVIVESGGAQATDKMAREYTVGIEVHIDPDQGVTSLLALVKRVKEWICLQGWKPTPDGIATYRTGLQFKRESGDQPDERYNTLAVQVVFCAYGQDRTSLKGAQG